MLILRIETTEGVTRHEVGDAPIVLGRSDDSDLVIADPEASRRHVRLTPRGNGLLVTDLGSANGTWLGSVRIDQGRVGPGESIRIGESVILVHSETPKPVRRRPSIAKPLLGALLPALLLFVLVEIGASAAGSSRSAEVEEARRRLDSARYEIARLPAETSPRNPVGELEALTRFLEEYPDSGYADDAREEIRLLGPQVERLRRARAELEALTHLREANTLPFAELYFRYQKVLENAHGLPELSAKVRAALRELDSSRQEEIRGLVQGAMDDATELSARGEYGRAASLLAAFGKRNPSAASSWEEQLGKAEAEVNKRALYAYRDLLTRSDEMFGQDEAAGAVELLRKEAVRFTGTRFRALLLGRADTLASRSGGAVAEGSRSGEIARRRSYDLMAAEAEELASAGYFLRAADKYAAVVPHVTVDSIREEFELRESELRALDVLIERVKADVRREGAKFGAIRFGDTRFKVLGMEGDTLRLGFRKSEISRDWGAFTPDEELAVLRSAKLTPDERLLLAVYCFYLSLRTDYEAEIIESLSHDESREAASRLYARKEGRPFPEGGFLAWKGRILTREEHAEEIHREKIAGLRQRQTTLSAKLLEHPAFARLRKLGERRAELDKARAHALALIFDEVKYFYPYRNRMAEYTPVQMEVDARVAAVRAIWDDPVRLTVKRDAAMNRMEKEIEAANAELEQLGVDVAESRRNLDRVLLYVDKPLTIRTYFVSPAEYMFHEYNRRAMEYNAALATVATDPEREQVRITNEYRIMMGRRAIIIDDRLVKSARGHCEEMQRLGYFGHFSPIPERKTPDLRAKIEGYKGSAVSENCHRGSGHPRGAHNGWVHSSGHHRNLLRRFWTEMGTGQAGKHWTQNFGRTKLKDFDAKPEMGK